MGECQVVEAVLVLERLFGRWSVVQHTFNTLSTADNRDGGGLVTMQPTGRSMIYAA